MAPNWERIRKNVQSATTEDLLDRITVYRKGMEPAAIEIIEMELQNRGVDEAMIAAHQESRQDCLLDSNGYVRECSFCHAPAVARHWAWHWMWGKIPVFPRMFYYCEKHLEKTEPRPT